MAPRDSAPLPPEPPKNRKVKDIPDTGNAPAFFMVIAFFIFIIMMVNFPIS